MKNWRRRRKEWGKKEEWCVAEGEWKKKEKNE